MNNHTEVLLNLLAKLEYLENLNEYNDEVDKELVKPKFRELEQENEELKEKLECLES